MVKVKVINESVSELPKYETIGSSGMDVHANIHESIILKPFERKLIPTGIHVNLPVGYELQVRPRSGLSLKHGITCCNAIGTIDSDYTGDIGVILINLSNEEFTINPGDRIAQMVCTKYEKVLWEQVDVLKETERGSGGFGHTGVK